MQVLAVMQVMQLMIADAGLSSIAFEPDFHVCYSIIKITINPLLF